LGLAEAYRVKGLYPDAEREIQEALRLDPTHQDARLALGVVYLQQERWADASAEFQRLVDDPSFIRPARALVNLGWAHYKSGDLDQAQATFERALKLEKQNYTAHLDLGIVLYDKGDLVEAINHFEECVRIIGERPAPVFGGAEAEARFRMARAYVRLNQRERAVDALRVAVERGGQSEWARKSSDYLKVLQ
jgi:type IV pilus assembly protein PilF